MTSVERKWGLYNPKHSEIDKYRILFAWGMTDDHEAEICFEVTKNTGNENSVTLVDEGAHSPHAQHILEHRFTHAVLSPEFRNAALNSIIEEPPFGKAAVFYQDGEKLFARFER